MPAERINVSFEPRPLELLYHKYGPNKITPSSSTTPFNNQATPSSLLKSTKAAAAAAAAGGGGGGTRAGRSMDNAPRIHRRQELGDLKKLGRELSKMERVQMFLDMSNAVGKAKGKSRSQPSSAGLKDLKCWSTSCPHCSQDHKHDSVSKLKDLKSKLKLVAARSLPSSDSQHTTTSPLRHSSHHVVPLPLLPLHYKRNASSSEDFAASRDAQQSLRHMLFPQPSVSRRAAAAWNYRFTGVPAAPPAHAFFRDPRQKRATSSHSSSPVLPSATAPACSPVDDPYEAKSATTFDADRMDSDQFGYVFDHVSGSSSSGSWISASAQSDTATYSARAQRPSTTDTVPTPQRYVETRASMAAPLSPASPPHRPRDGESWPPQYTVVPSWPSLDDPFRFQYFGCSIHRDVMRKVYKARGRRRNGKAARGSDADQQPLQPPQPQKLKVVVPIYADCSMCTSLDCEHGNSPKPAPASLLPSCPPSITAKSAKSRSSLSMSVCTVLSRHAPPPSSFETVPKLRDKSRLSARPAENFYGRATSLHSKDRSISSYGNSVD